MPPSCSMHSSLRFFCSWFQFVICWSISLSTSRSCADFVQAENYTAMILHCRVICWLWFGYYPVFAPTLYRHCSETVPKLLGECRCDIVHAVIFSIHARILVMSGCFCCQNFASFFVDPACRCIATAVILSIQNRQHVMILPLLGIPVIFPKLSENGCKDYISVYKANSSQGRYLI